MAEERILITGASGQIGTELTHALGARYGMENIVATDIQDTAYSDISFIVLDVLNEQRMREILEDYRITQVYHLAAILSANGEWNPMKTWNVNMNGLLSLLKHCVDLKIKKLFFPSTIAVFGGPTPKLDTPQHSPMIPTTVYGMSKLTGELWCNYYHKRYGLDVRSIRYPGIISYKAPPGGGTTDYAVEIFHDAIEHGAYTCFLEEDTRLPMIYMPDAIRGTVELMDAPARVVHERTSYNLSGMSFTPKQLAAEIKQHIPDFEINYQPDFRQEIAASWTESIDDSHASIDWGWKPEFDLASMTSDMLRHLREQYKQKATESTN